MQLRSDYYLLPFDHFFWIALLSVMLLGTFFILIIQQLMRSKKRVFTDDLFLVLESFSNQCGNDDIQNFSLRCICIFLRFTALISMAVYGAIITSFFAVETFKVPFTNLEDFVVNGEYKFITKNTTEFEHFTKVYRINRTKCIFIKKSYF